MCIYIVLRQAGARNHGEFILVRHEEGLMRSAIYKQGCVSGLGHSVRQWVKRAGEGGGRRQGSQAETTSGGRGPGTGSAPVFLTAVHGCACGRGAARWFVFTRPGEETGARRGHAALRMEVAHPAGGRPCCPHPRLAVSVPASRPWKRSASIRPSTVNPSVRRRATA
jgi:hypothetical protein